MAYYKHMMHELYDGFWPLTQLYVIIVTGGGDIYIIYIIRQKYTSANTLLLIIPTCTV